MKTEDIIDSLMVVPELENLLHDIEPEAKHVLTQKLQADGFKGNIHVVKPVPKTEQARKEFEAHGITEGGPRVILDGHITAQLCKEHNIPIPAAAIVEIELDSFIACKMWRFRHHTGRRNMKDWQKCDMARKFKKHYATIGKQRQANSANGEEPFVTMEALAIDFGVSRTKLQRYEKVLKEAPELIELIHQGDMTINGAHSRLNDDESSARESEDADAGGGQSASTSVACNDGSAAPGGPETQMDPDADDDSENESASQPVDEDEAEEKALRRKYIICKTQEDLCERILKTGKAIRFCQVSIKDKPGLCVYLVPRTDIKFTAESFKCYEHQIKSYANNIIRKNGCLQEFDKSSSQSGEADNKKS